MMNRLIAVMSISLGLAVLAGPADAHAADDIMLADFEGADYGDWKIEGNAFGSAPAKGTLPEQKAVRGFEGEGLVNTFLNGDGTTGKLTSPGFAIKRDYIKFLIGGGAHPGKTCINLLIDGKIVRSATGDNDEFLNWKNWDVKEFKGRKAVLEIADSEPGGWGHINVDQILQSNTKSKKNPLPSRHTEKAPKLENAMEVKITGKYLLFPVSNNGHRGRMTIVVDDELVHNLDCDFAPNKDSIDWWSYLDMSEYIGKTARVKAAAPAGIPEMIESSDEIRHLQPLYDEALRPQFHMSQMRGWNNDPNGLCYYDGEYHFFWQCNPGGRNWANMYWGHAVSPDMFHWTELSRALRSFGGNVKDRHPAMADASCFSGSGNVDIYNTAGWQKGDEKTMVVAFSDTGCGEALAYSTDRGRTWQYYEGNPIIRHRGGDPKLIWYEAGQHWVIAVYDERPPHGGNVSIYTSRDLHEWEYQSSIPGYHVCAEIFQLPVDGDPAKARWVIYSGDAMYAIGHFDGKIFTPEHPGKHRVHWGAYYASQCFSGAPEGRVVQIGWARIDMPDMPFNQAFSLPTELTLHTTEDGIRMFANPVKELEQLRKPDPKTVKNAELTPESPAVEFDVDGQLFDISATLKQGTAARAVLRFGGNAITYDFNAAKLDEMPLKTKNDRITLRVLVDRPMFEVVGGGGACYKTSARGGAGKPVGTISLTAEGGALTVESLEAYEMKSAWFDR